MAAQFLLNLFIAVLWVLLKDEDVFNVQTFATGFVIGIIIVTLLRRYFGGPLYLRRVYAIIKLIFIFIVEIFSSTVVVVKHILSPKINIKPGIFAYKTNLTSDWEITTLALLLTLTPGSVVMELNEEGNVFYIHAMDITLYKSDLERWLKKFEQAIMEVTR